MWLWKLVQVLGREYEYPSRSGAGHLVAFSERCPQECDDFVRANQMHLNGCWGTRRIRGELYCPYRLDHAKCTNAARGLEEEVEAPRELSADVRLANNKCWYKERCPQECDDFVRANQMHLDGCWGTRRIRGENLLPISP